VWCVRGAAAERSRGAGSEGAGAVSGCGWGDGARAAGDGWSRRPGDSVVSWWRAGGVGRAGARAGRAHGGSARRLGGSDGVCGGPRRRGGQGRFVC